jgi:hypothetical protein
VCVCVCVYGECVSDSGGGPLCAPKPTYARAQRGYMQGQHRHRDRRPHPFVHGLLFGCWCVFVSVFVLCLVRLCNVTHTHSLSVRVCAQCVWVLGEPCIETAPHNE